MFGRWFRSGIRTQITFIVIISAVLTTAATLVIADTSITQYGDRQARTEINRNLKIADLVRTTTYGASISISDDGDSGDLVVDSPTVNQQNFTTDPVHKNFGKLSLNQDTSFVDQVHTLLGGAQVSVYQCQNKAREPIVGGCPRISTTLMTANGLNRDVNSAANPHLLASTSVNDIVRQIGTSGYAAYPQTIQGVQYMVGYHLFFDPGQDAQGGTQAPIGVLEIDLPLTEINGLISTTTLSMIAIGIVIMIAGIILALIVASAISSTLNRAAKQLGSASNQLMDLSRRQSGGSSQQVWAINAINKGLQNLKESSADISRRTDQIAQIGTQVAYRRPEISPQQLDSIMAYMTRSVRDISLSGHNHASTVERMIGAMEAVTEVADQVADNSRQMSGSAERLDVVVGQLESLLTGRLPKDVKAAPAKQAKSRSKQRREMLDEMMMAPDRMGEPSRPRIPGGSRPQPLSLPDAVRPISGDLQGAHGRDPMGGRMVAPPLLPGARPSPLRQGQRESGMWDMQDRDPGTR